ncbi:MAG: GTPase ObgE [Spirochaetota bacterium]
MDPFLDEITLAVTAGHGGPGAVSFRREAGVPKGGPDGGDGGKGGDVIFICDRRETTFYKLRTKRELFARNGDSGKGCMMSGKAGDDLIIRLPEGSVIFSEDGAVVADLTRDGETFIGARGGKGGKGNKFYTTSTNRAPDYAQHGLSGEAFTYRLEIKLIADVGLVGLPNAGKSTLIAHLTKAHPKIAAYPFTTLTPHLGVCYIDVDASFIIADIPGIIEGAHEGLGLGISFLKHVERTRVLAFVIDLYEVDPATAYRTLLNELLQYKDELAKKPAIAVLTKTDLIDVELLPEMIREFREGIRGSTIEEVFAISAATGDGVAPMRNALYHISQRHKTAVSS